MKEIYSQILTDDDIKNTAPVAFVHTQKPEKLVLAETTHPRSNVPTYSIKCPTCGETNKEDFWIWPRGVNKSNDRKLSDALDSNGDKLSIAFECENCNTTFDLIVEKRNGFQLRLEQTGFRVHD